MELDQLQSFKKVYFTSLGCSKNLVDSQVMLGKLDSKGFEVTHEPENADVIIVNTCAFIGPSKMESIETVLDLAEFKSKDQGNCKALVMAGCLAQRYSQDLEKEMPEVDLFIGTGEYDKVAFYLRALEEGKLEKKSFVEIPKYIHTEFDPRINTSPSYMAWLKISEGCNRNCTFCIIPTLRGKLRSRTVSSLVAEAQKLADQGVKEINLISQDLSDYGVDLSAEDSLPNLLTSLEKVSGVEWIRLFYYYPDDLSEDVMRIISQSKKICKYLDMPIQHFSTAILKKMNRRVTTEQIYAKINRLREYIPSIVLRTSVIVGFPGETEEDFNLLLKGIEDLQFDHLGVFKYSDEEGTSAVNLKQKVSQDIIDARFEKVYKAQKKILQKINKKMVNKVVEVLVEGPSEESEFLLQGRYQGQAPEIDGNILINDGMAKPGDFVKVKISKVIGYDYLGAII